MKGTWNIQCGPACIALLFLVHITSNLANPVQRNDRSTCTPPEQAPSTVSSNTLALYPFNTDPDTFPSFSNTVSSSCNASRASNVNVLCPYEYVIDYDENRIPQKVMTARCLCPGCRDMDHRIDRKCKEITYDIDVLTKGPCNNGYQMYNKANMTVTVGCVCYKV